MQEIRVKFNFDYIRPRVVCIGENEFCWYDVDRLLTALMDLKVRVEHDATRDSICLAISKHLTSYWAAGRLVSPRRMILSAIFEMWPLYSGDIKYPVPSPNNARDAGDEWLAAIDSDSMWTGKYGEDRRNLLDFLIAKLQEYHQTE